MDTPLVLLPDAPLLEEDVVDSHNWQETVELHTLNSLSSREIDRQAVIYGTVKFQVSVCIRTTWRFSHESLVTLQYFPDHWFIFNTFKICEPGKSFSLLQSCSRRSRLTCGHSGFWIRCSSRKCETFWPQTSCRVSSLTCLRSTSCTVSSVCRRWFRLSFNVTNVVWWPSISVLAKNIN